jgi:hypothetical protein
MVTQHLCDKNNLVIKRQMKCTGTQSFTGWKYCIEYCAQMEWLPLNDKVQEWTSAIQRETLYKWTQWTMRGQRKLLPLTLWNKKSRLFATKTCTRVEMFPLRLVDCNRLVTSSVHSFLPVSSLLYLSDFYFHVIVNLASKIMKIFLSVLI